MAGQVAGQVRSGQVRSGHVRSGQVAGQVAGQVTSQFHRADRVRDGGSIVLVADSGLRDPEAQRRALMAVRGNLAGQSRVTAEEELSKWDP